MIDGYIIHDENILEYVTTSSIDYHHGIISKEYLPLDDIKELTKEQIQYTIRNYVRKERFNDLEDRYHKDMLILLDKISNLERKLNEVYYPMRTEKY